jgi:hypothetical protein
MHRHSGAFGAVLDVYTEVVTMDADAVKLPSFAEAVSGWRARAHSDHVWAVFFEIGGRGLAARPLQGLTQSATRNQQRRRWTRSKPVVRLMHTEISRQVKRLSLADKLTVEAKAPEGRG